MKNQQVEYDNSQIFHTTSDFYETNAWLHKINMLQTHQTTFLMSNMPSSVLSLLNLSLANGFVMSAYFCPHLMFNSGYLIEFVCLKSDLIDNSDN